MKFDFCGGFDAPDWLLSEIATLSNISSVRVKLLCNQIISKLVDNTIDFAKIRRLTEDTEFTSSDVKAILSALNFILSNAVRNDVDADTLSNELEQLGLPKESANAIKRAYIKNKQVLSKALKQRILSLPAIKTSKENIEWSVDYVLSSSILQKVNESLVRLQLNMKEDGQPIDVNMTSSQLDSFLHELKTVQAMMQEIE
mmetsp:Transcript_51774/g.82579  ORF Transcript_51774/g.82579 Transcript_51774/m.82579 type:complete len:200 (+) Transcript_51774:64-663(+)